MRDDTFILAFTIINSKETPQWDVSILLNGGNKEEWKKNYLFLNLSFGILYRSPSCGSLLPSLRTIR